MTSTLDHRSRDVELPAIRRAAAALSGVCLVAALIGVPQAEACSCASVKMREAFKRSDGAIIGKLRDVTPIESAASIRGGEGPVGPGRREFIYRVRRVYKGERRIEAGKRLEVRSWSSGASCGLPRRRTRLGLFLDRKQRHWTSNLCWTVPAERMRRAGERRGSVVALCSRIATTRRQAGPADALQLRFT